MRCSRLLFKQERKPWACGVWECIWVRAAGEKRCRNESCVIYLKTRAAASREWFILWVLAHSTAGCCENAPRRGWIIKSWFAWLARPPLSPFQGKAPCEWAKKIFFLTAKVQQKVNRCAIAMKKTPLRARCWERSRKLDFFLLAGPSIITKHPHAHAETLPVIYVKII